MNINIQYYRSFAKNNTQILTMHLRTTLYCYELLFSVLKSTPNLRELCLEFSTICSEKDL